VLLAGFWNWGLVLALQELANSTHLEVRASCGADPMTDGAQSDCFWRDL